MTPTTDARNKTATPRLAFFERYLSLWVALCMVTGVIIGKAIPVAVQAVRGLEFGKGSQINGPIAVLIWLCSARTLARHWPPLWASWWKSR